VGETWEQLNFKKEISITLCEKNECNRNLEQGLVDGAIKTTS
jgi:hypothetical protein